MVLPLVGAIASVSMFELTTIAVSGSASFPIDRPGTWVLASETRGEVGGETRVGGETSLSDLTLIGPDGTPAPVRAPERAIRYETPERDGVVIGSFHAATGGTWTVRRSGGAGEMALLAVGPDPAEAAVWWLLVPGGLAVMLLGVAGGCGWVAFRASRGRGG